MARFEHAVRREVTRRGRPCAATPAGILPEYRRDAI